MATQLERIAEVAKAKPKERLMKAVCKHTDCKWIIKYIERWLKAPFQTKEGKILERTAGTPQGGVMQSFA